MVAEDAVVEAVKHRLADHAAVTEANAMQVAAVLPDDVTLNEVRQKVAHPAEAAEEVVAVKPRQPTH